MKQLRNNILAIILMIGTSMFIHAQALTSTDGIIDVVAGRSSSFPVNLLDGMPDAYNALTLTIQLPEGFNLTSSPLLTKKWKNPFCVSQENIVLPDSAFLQNAESVMFYALGDMNENRCIKMAIASAFELPGTNVDSLLTFHFNVASNIDTRIYSFKLQNILFEYDSNKHDNPSDVNVRIRVSKLGDANHDDKIRLDDATLLVNYILNKTSEVEYNAFLADMNDDGVIDIFDIMKLINAIVHGTQSVLDDNLS